MPPRRDPEFVFPPEITQLIQQQNTLIQTLVQNEGNNNNNNNPPPPPPVDHLARFLRLNPPVFSSSTKPIVADDWLRKIGRELTTAGCTDGEKVKFAAHQLDGPATAWWEISQPLTRQHYHMGPVSTGLSYCPCFNRIYGHEEA